MSALLDSCLKFFYRFTLFLEVLILQLNSILEKLKVTFPLFVILLGFHNLEIIFLPLQVFPTVDNVRQSLEGYPGI